MTEADPAASGRDRGPGAILLGITLAYLVFELGFSARLLDASGGLAEIGEIKSIERWGRTLSGIAVALFAWGWILKARWRLPVTLAAMAGAVAVAVPSMFAFQDHIVDSAIADLDGKQRRDASFLVVATRFMLGGHLRVADLELPPESWNSAEAKAFIALFPVLAAQIPDLEDDARAVLDSTLRGYMTSACTVGQGGCLGPFEEFNNKIWRPVIEEVNASYRRYGEGANRYADAMDGIPAEQDRAWENYRRKLAQKGYAPGSVPRMGWGRVRNEVRQQGVPVPEGWAPSDRATFNAAVEREVRHRAETAYADGMRKAVGEVLPHALSIGAFMRQPAIQRKLQAKMGIADLGVPLDYLVEPGAIHRQVYEPILKAAVRRRIQVHTADAREFEPGGRNAELGQQSAERLIVPPLALGFSLAGGLSHLMKSLYLSLVLATGRRRIGIAALLAVLAFAAVGGSMATNAVTGSPVYRDLEAQVRQGRGRAIAAGLRWIVQVEPLAYPVNETLRRVALMGLTYGFQPKELPPPPKRAVVHAAEKARTAPSPLPIAAPVPAAMPVAATTPEATGTARSCASEIHAHRGARPEAENTAAAIAAAGRLGFDAAEIDVQPLKGGDWAVHHDALTGRAVTGSRLPASAIAASDWGRLRAVDGQGRDAGPPSLFADAVAAANAGGIRLHIEVKAPVTCAQVDDLVARARVLDKAPHWSTVFPGVARCLAARSVDHLGLVVGPQDPGAKVTRGLDKLQALAGRVGVDGEALRQKAEDLYDTGANRSLLEGDGLSKIADMLAGARRRAVHLPHTDLTDTLVRQAAGAGLTVAVYAEDGSDAAMAAAVRGLRAAAPVFIITEARPAVFCPVSEARQAPVPAPAGPVTGVASLVDTATLRIQGETVPLAHLDPVRHPKADEAARSYLAEVGEVSCTRLGTGGYACRVPRKNLDLAEVLVLSGLATVKAGAPEPLAQSEKMARGSRSGIWAASQ